MTTLYLLITEDLTTQYYYITEGTMGNTYYNTATSSPTPIKSGILFSGTTYKEYLGTLRYDGIRIKNDLTSDSIKFKENGTSTYTTLNSGGNESSVLTYDNLIVADNSSNEKLHVNDIGTIPIYVLFYEDMSIQYYYITADNYYDPGSSSPTPIETGTISMASKETINLDETAYDGTRIKNDFSSDNLKYKEKESSSTTTLGSVSETSSSLTFNDIIITNNSNTEIMEINNITILGSHLFVTISSSDEYYISTGNFYNDVGYSNLSGPVSVSTISTPNTYDVGNTKFTSIKFKNNSSNTYFYKQFNSNNLYNSLFSGNSKINNLNSITITDNNMSSSNDFLDIRFVLLNTICILDFNSNDYNSRTITDQTTNGYSLNLQPSDFSDPNYDSSPNWITDDPFSDSEIYSYNFDGNGYFKLQNEPGRIMNNNIFSLSIWFKPNSSFMAQYESIFSSATHSIGNSNLSSLLKDTFQIGTISSGSTLYVYCNVDSSATPAEDFKYSIGSYTNGNWNHIVVTYDETTLKTYLNNGTSNNYTTSLEFNIEDIKLGTDRTNTYKFSGMISRVSLYKLTLNSSDVNSLYNNVEVCYHPDTIILTNQGHIKITDLKRGDLIKTLNGYKPLSKLLKNINIKNKFMEFPKNCFGENIPNQDLYITTGHPVYFNDEFYLPENFIGKKNIKLISKDAVYVYHLQFDTHEVVYSNNFTTTSLPSNTDYQNLHLKEEEFIDKTKFNKDNIGKMYPPYMLHEEPLLIQEIDL